MDQTLGASGRAAIVTGLVPAVVFLALNLALAELAGAAWAERLRMVTDLTIAGLLAAVLPLGILLYAANPFIIHVCEGELPVMRRLLSRLTRRNERRHDEVYGELQGLQRMRAAALERLRAADATLDDELARQVDSASLGIDRAYADIARGGAAPLLPVRRERVKPTRLGNAYASIEEYPYERYGMDAMTFWPRLLAVTPADYRQSIGEQKTNCDFLLHTAAVAFLVAVEALVVAGLELRWTLLAFSAPSIVCAYALYRAAVAETLTLGKLIDGAFDLYRHALLDQLLGARLDRRLPLDVERRVWQRLDAFVRRGEEFYYPLDALRGHQPAAAPEEPATIS